MSTQQSVERGPGQSSGFRYQPPLDALRGLAVLGVMLYHAGVLPGGFLGVDAFFVLSGFLITSLLLVELRGRRRLDLRAFWARRARRLLPALFLLLLAVAAYAAFVASTSQVKPLRADSLATLFYFANWHQLLLHRSYFDMFSSPSMLQHTWSLAIEEQWYLVWPLALPLLLRLTRHRPQRLLLVIGGLAGLSALWMGVLSRAGGDPSRVYFGTDTRAQSLLVGAGLAVLLLWRPGPRTRAGRVGLQAGGLVAVGVLAALWAAISDHSQVLYRGGLLVEALAVALVIAAVVQPARTALRAALSFPPLRWVGWISYGLYLWHWPIDVFLSTRRTHLAGAELIALQFAVTFAIAIASYVVIEAPIRHGALRRQGIRARVVLPAAVTVVLVALLVSTSSLFGLGARRQAAARTQDVVNVSATEVARRQVAEQAWAREHRSVTALVVGDSRALSISESYGTQLGQPDLAVQSVAKLSCGITAGQIAGGTSAFQQPDCSDWPARFRYGVGLFHPDVTVMLVGTWEIFDRVVNGQTIHYGTPEWTSYVDSQLDQALAVLGQQGAPLVLLNAPCTSMSGPFEWNQGLSIWNQVQDAWAARHPTQVRVVDLNAYLCPLSKWDATLQGAPVFPDGMHFSQASGALVWQWLGPQLVQIARTWSPSAGFP